MMLCDVSIRSTGFLLNVRNPTRIAMFLEINSETMAVAFFEASTLATGTSDWDEKGAPP